LAEAVAHAEASWAPTAAAPAGAGGGDAPVAPAELALWRRTARALALQARLRDALGAAGRLAGGAHADVVHGVLSPTQVGQRASDVLRAEPHAAHEDFHLVLIAVFDYERSAANVANIGAQTADLVRAAVEARGFGDWRAPLRPDERDARRAHGAALAVRLRDALAGGLASSGPEPLPPLEPGARPAFATVAVVYELERYAFVGGWLDARAPQSGWLGGALARGGGGAAELAEDEVRAAYRAAFDAVAADEREADAARAYTGGLATFMAHVARAWAALFAPEDRAAYAARADADALARALEAALAAAQQEGGARAPARDGNEDTMPLDVDFIEAAVGELKRDFRV